MWKMELKKLKILFEENRILHYFPTHTHAILWRTVQAQELKSLYFDSHGGYFKHGRGGHFIMFIRLGSLWNMCGPNAKSNFTVRRWLRYFDVRWRMSKQILYPFYSMYIAPTDFHIFKQLTLFFLLAIGPGTTTRLYPLLPQRLQSQAALFFEKGIQILVARYDQCLNNVDTYVEN